MNKELIEKCNVLARRVETPSSNWSADGKPDPHGKTYDCERAGLHMGNMTDDELANGAFLNYDQPLNVAGILAGTCHSPIAWMTAVKDRIRWLSRSLEKVAAERDALAAELKSLREQMPVGIVDEGDDGVFADLETTSGVIVKLGDKLYARPVPARDLTDADIGRCIASADRSFAQEPISGSPVLGVWSKHLARAIERYLKGEGK